MVGYDRALRPCWCMIERSKNRTDISFFVPALGQGTHCSSPPPWSAFCWFRWDCLTGGISSFDFTFASRVKLKKKHPPPPPRGPGACLVSGISAPSNVQLAAHLSFWTLQLAFCITDHGEWYRLVTSMALHGGVAHLLCNCMSLGSIGPAVSVAGTEGRKEERWGILGCTCICRLRLAGRMGR